MSSTKEERRAEKAIDRSIEETKDTTRRVVQEAKRELPEFVSAFHDYQEQNIDAIKEITYNTLEMQKVAAKSNQSIYGSYMNAMLAPWLSPYYWMPSQQLTDMYTSITSNAADTSIAATRFANEMMLASLEATRNSFEYTRNSTKDLVKLYTESAETAEELSKDLGRTSRRS
jgi:hypothetical protein